MSSPDQAMTLNARHIFWLMGSFDAAMTASLFLTSIPGLSAIVPSGSTRSNMSMPLVRPCDLNLKITDDAQRIGFAVASVLLTALMMFVTDFFGSAFSRAMNPDGAASIGTLLWCSFRVLSMLLVTNDFVLSHASFSPGYIGSFPSIRAIFSSSLYTSLKCTPVSPRSLDSHGLPYVPAIMSIMVYTASRWPGLRYEMKSSVLLTESSMAATNASRVHACPF